MSKVTEKNTKKEIMDYVKELEAKLSEKSDARATIEDKQRETKVKEIKKSAEELIDTGIVNEKTAAQYNDLLETIKLLDKELEEVYEIQRKVHTLEALIITYDDKMVELIEKNRSKTAELEEEFNTKKSHFDNLLKKAQEEHSKLIKELNAQFAEEKAKLEKERAREKEEYVYKTKRERAIDDDNWVDVKAEREAKLSAREEIAENKISEAEEVLTELEELKTSVDALKQDAKDSYDKGLEEGKKKAATTHAIETNHLKKEHVWALEKVKGEKDSFEEQLKLERQAHETTKKKLDEAYAQITNTAMAVANAGVKVTMDNK